MRAAVARCRIVELTVELFDRIRPIARHLSAISDGGGASYSGVVGLPLFEVCQLLRGRGYPVP